MRKIVSFFGEQTDLFIQLNQKAQDYASSLGYAYEWAPQSKFIEQNIIATLADADVGIIDIEEYGDRIFRQLTNRTKLLIRFGVGYDKVDLKAATRHNIAIARTTGANTNAVAEMALTLMLSTKRNLLKGVNCIKTCNWKKDIGHEIISSTVGIVGFGGIGKRLTQLLTGFDCQILAYDPYASTEIMDQYGVKKVDLEFLFRNSDAISLHLPYIEATHHLIDKSMLDLMKPTAVLINTARGNIVDEAALYNALVQNQIAGAGFDVFALEPLPANSPLLTLENVVLTPHISSQTVESLWNIYKTAIDIAADFFTTGNSPHLLNKVQA